jgi:drug/metabolite transporter (DMT)-like permease
MRHSWIGILYLTAAAAIWGGMYVVSKYVLAYVPPFTLLWMRYVIAVAILYGFWKRIYKTSGSRFTKSDWFAFAGIGFVGYFLSVGTQFVGTKLSDAHTGSLITASSPAFTFLFARLFLKERITVQNMVSLLLSSFGVLMVIGFDSQGIQSVWGDAFLVIAAVTWSLLSVFARRSSQHHSALTITTFALLFAILFTTPVMIWELFHTPMTFAEWANWKLPAGVLYLGIVSTAVAFYCWNKGLEKIDAGVSSLFLFVQTLVGSLCGWAILHEPLHTNFLIGGVCITMGLVLETPLLVWVRRITARSETHQV